MAAQGRIVWVSGPAVRADGMSDAKMYETVTVGNSKLVGEVIRFLFLPSSAANSPKVVSGTFAEHTIAPLFHYWAV